VDAAISRTLDTLISIPNKMFALVVVAAFGSAVPVLVVMAGIIYTPGAYRIARSLAVSVNAQDYVTVSRARGEGTLYLAGAEILPNIIGPVLADFGLRFVYIVLLRAGMSFLGLGVQPPNADRGVAGAGEHGWAPRGRASGDHARACHRLAHHRGQPGDRRADRSPPRRDDVT
jgi:peptide/nickel transport system permease protein